MYKSFLKKLLDLRRPGLEHRARAVHNPNLPVALHAADGLVGLGRNFEGLDREGHLAHSFMPSVQTTFTLVFGLHVLELQEQEDLLLGRRERAAIPTGSRFSTLLAISMRAMVRSAHRCCRGCKGFTGRTPGRGRAPMFRTGACCAIAIPAKTVRHTTRTNTAAFFLFLSSLYDGKVLVPVSRADAE